MSATQSGTAEITLGDQVPFGSWETFSRELPFEVTEADGRNIHARVVPYNVVARVADPPHFVPYQERFLPGAFAAQMSAASRVLLNFEHRQGISDVIGRGVRFDDQPDGLHAEFRVMQHSDGDKALELINAGVLRGMSAEFSAKRSRTVGGVVERLDARVGNVALCREFTADYAGPKAAYQGAEVLAVRTDDGSEETDIVVPSAEPMAADMLERLKAIGVEPVLLRAVVRKPWDGSAGRFTDDEYARSCLIDRGGDTPVKERCSLPVLEPNGDLNVNALGAAAARLNQVDAGRDLKAAAARKLIRYYRQAQMEPPAGVVALARS